MITHKIQVSTDLDKQAGLEYVEFEASDMKNIETAMVECAKFTPNDVHTLAVIPIWEYLCERYHAKFNHKFSFTPVGVVAWALYRIYRFMFRRVSLEKYMEIYGVTKND